MNESSMIDIEPTDSEVNEAIIESGLFNKKELKEMELKTEPKKEKEKEKEKPKEKKKSKKELKNEQIKEAKERSEQTINEVFQTTTENKVNNDAYAEMDYYLQMVALGINNATTIQGRGGLGKTYRIMATLTSQELELKLGKKLKIAYLTGFVTPAEFYVWMYKHRDYDIKILDDVDGLDKVKCLSLLKGALWEVKGKRLVQYLTTKPLKDEYDDPLPDKYIENARFIIVTNELKKKSEHMKAVLTRVNFCKVEVSYNQLMDILYQVSLVPYKTLIDLERKEIYDYIKNHTTEATMELNIRTMIKMFDFYELSKKTGDFESWKTLSLKMLEPRDKYRIVHDLMDDLALDISDKVAEFKRITGESRATFFRIQAKIKRRIKDNANGKQEPDKENLG